MADGSATLLKFSALSSAVDASFLSELGQRKLHEYKLDDAMVEIRGSFARADRQVSATSVFAALPGKIKIIPPPCR